MGLEMLLLVPQPILGCLLLQWILPGWDPSVPSLPQGSVPRPRASLTHARLVLSSVPLCSSPLLQTLSELSLLILGLPHPASLCSQPEAMGRWQSFQISG